MTYATSNTTKRTHFQCVFFVLRFETDNFKQSRYVGILYKQYFGGFICAMINLTNNKQNKWLSSGSAGTCHSVHTW